MEKWFTRNTWKGANDEIQRQNCKSFDMTKEENSDRTHWIDQKYQEGLLIPTCSKIQLMTNFNREDENRLGYLYSFNYQLTG